MVNPNRVLCLAFEIPPDRLKPRKCLDPGFLAVKVLALRIGRVVRDSMHMHHIYIYIYVYIYIYMCIYVQVFVCTLIIYDVQHP